MLAPGTAGQERGPGGLLGGGGRPAERAYLVIQHPADVLQVVVVQEQVRVELDPASELRHADHSDVRADVAAKAKPECQWDGQAVSPTRQGARVDTGLSQAWSRGQAGKTRGPEAKPYR